MAPPVTGGLTDRQCAVLAALCDTFVPAVDAVPDPNGSWARRASDLNVPFALELLLQARLPAEQVDAVGELLDAMDRLGLVIAPQAAREAIVAGVAASSPEAAAGVDGLRQGALLLAYAMPGPEGPNPFWKDIGYAGPLSFPPPAPKTIATLTATGDTELRADAVVVGSGAGGGVAAAELVAGGLDVVVLEAGGYFDGADFVQSELWAYQNLYLRGGPFPSADRNVTLLAGRALGGGTTVNWSNSVRPREQVRRAWAEEHGLTDVATASFDRHLDAVLARIKANEICSDYNGPHQRMAAGAAKLGYALRRALLNIDPDRYDPACAGHTGFGDASGAKQGTMKTFLQDAFDGGARILVRCAAERILVERGRAAGVLARHTDGAGRVATVTVRAPVVVAACGAIETPALLLRSGIGGPAAGRHLRLHPAGAVSGVYEQDQHPWWGPAQAAMVEEFADLQDGFGFLVEGTHFTTGLAAAATPWRSGADHKALWRRGGKVASLILLLRDRGHGRVTIDGRGQALVWYPLDDPLDRRHFRRGLAEVARIHEAAEASEIIGLAAGVPPWHRGDDPEAWIERLAAVPPGASGQPVFSAHQMGSARMGTNPASSVADPRGELHDTPGVWIGDSSAFPTAAGVNPMVTCQALARRTAAAIRSGRSS